MHIIDTHCHLIDDAFTGRTDEVVCNAMQADVRQMVLACCSDEEFDQIVALCQQYEGTLFPTLGIHPENMEDDIEKQWNVIQQKGDDYLARGGSLAAVGEIGIDLHWDQTRLADQLRLLEWQCDWAVSHQLPVLLHIRDAMDAWMDFFDHYRHRDRLQGILHCYSGDARQAAYMISQGDWYFGIGGTLTYKKSLVPEVACAIGIDRLVLETDAPYLAPVPYRGKCNEPAYTALTAEALARLLGKEKEEIARITTRNARKVLRLEAKTGK